MIQPCTLPQHLSPWTHQGSLSLSISKFSASYIPLTDHLLQYLKFTTYSISTITIFPLHHGIELMECFTCPLPDVSSSLFLQLKFIIIKTSLCMYSQHSSLLYSIMMFYKTPTPINFKSSLILFLYLTSGLWMEKKKERKHNTILTHFTSNSWSENVHQFFTMPINCSPFLIYFMSHSLRWLLYIIYLPPELLIASLHSHSCSFPSSLIDRIKGIRKECW